MRRCLLKRSRNSKYEDRRATRYPREKEQIGALMKFMYAYIHDEPIPADAIAICERVMRIKRNHPRTPVE